MDRGRAGDDKVEILLMRGKKTFSVAADEAMLTACVPPPTGLLFLQVMWLGCAPFLTPLRSTLAEA